MALSYAQNMEDYHLALAFEGQPAGFYVDIGAGHPVADNVSLWFYERGWRGLIAEPQHKLTDLYPRIRPRDLIHKGLVGRNAGVTEFFQFAQLHGLSTTVRDHAHSAKDLDTAYEILNLPVVTLTDLFETHHISTIDFLKIDVEGGEADVLQGNDWNRFRPKIIVVEAVTPGKGEPAWANWEPLLLQNGYRFRLFDTLNRFYVAQEQSELFEKLPAERAPWDAVTHMYEIGRAPECASHPDHALAQQLARGFLASLPYLDEHVVADILQRGRIGASNAPADKLDIDHLRLALGRIACGYDGGQIFEL